MKKRLISLLVGLSMILTLIPMGMVSVSATESATLTPLFKLDLSTAATADGEITGLKDATGTIEDANIVAKSSRNNGTQRPILKTDADLNLKYLQFNREKDNDGAVVHVTTGDAGILDKTELTFEAWIKDPFLNANDAHSSIMFGIGYAGTNKNQQISGISLYEYNATSNTNGFQFFPDGRYGATSGDEASGQGSVSVASGNGKLKDYNDKWTHFVITRKWTPTDSEAPYGAGTWTSTMYMNGTPVEMATSSASVTSRTQYKTYATANSSAVGKYYTLAIGGGMQNYESNSYGGDIAAFNMYEGIMTAEQASANYASEKAKYGIAMADPVCTAANLDYAGGELTITFDEAINPLTVNNIKLVTADETDTDKDVTFATLDGTGKVATVKYGTLISGADYKLIVPTTVKTVGGATLKTQWEKALTATAYLIDEDFEDQTVDASATISGAKYKTLNEGASALVKQDNNNKYALLSTNDTGREILIAPNTSPNLYLDNVIVDDVGDKQEWQSAPGIPYGKSYVMEVAVKVDSSDTTKAASRHLFVDDSTNKTNENYVYLNPVTYNAHSRMAETPSTAYENRDADGFYRLRFVIGRSGELLGEGLNEGVQYDLYDTINGTKIGGAKYYDKVGGMYLAKLYHDNDTDSTKTTTMILDDIKAYYRKPMEVLGTSYDASERTISLKMSDDVNQASLNGITATVGGNAANVTSAYDANTRTIILSNLPEPGDYAINLSSVKTADFFECAAESVAVSGVSFDGLFVEYKSVVGEEETVIDSQTALDAATTVKAYATLYGYEGAEPVGFFAIYVDGELVKVTKAGNWDGTAMTMDATITGLPAERTGTAARFFVWNDITNISPLYEADDCL